MKEQTPKGNQTQRILEKKLESFKSKLGLAILNVIWAPDPAKNLSGEIKNKTIYIYEPLEEEACKVLKHEVVDYCVSQAIEPYKQVTNSLIKMLNHEAYRRKEQVVKMLTRLMARKKNM